MVRNIFKTHWLAWAITCLITTSAVAQQVEMETPLHKRDPFDQLTLDSENKGAVLDVFPIEKLPRTKRVDDIPTSLTVRLLDDPPERRYSVNTKSIVKLKLFPFILLDEAARLISARKVDDAFPYLARLKEQYPATPGLAKTTEDFFVQDARFLFTRKRYDEALQSLDEVYRLNPKRARLSQMLDGVLSQIIQVEYSAGNYESVRNKLDYAQRSYGAVTNKTVQQWESRLSQAAGEQLASARSTFSQGDAAGALALIGKAEDMWPDIDGLTELKRSILAKYPRIRVAVTQPYDAASNNPSHQQLNWAARRVAPLATREFVAFADFTSEGGAYACRIGTMNVKPDRQNIEIQLKQSLNQDTYELSRALLQQANPDSPTFTPRWAEYLSSLYVPQPNRLEIRLTRPSLRPEGLLPRAVPQLADGDAPLGDFTVKRSSPQVSTFQSRGTNRRGLGISELSEQYFSNAADATQALIAGTVDLVDRVYPTDLAQIESQNTLRIIPYRLPTLHALVFNDREPLLRSSTFRRGLLRSIDRQGFVKNELSTPGKTNARVISGFVPAGESKNDPLGYAYDHRIEPRTYDPALGLFLARLAVAQREEMLAQSVTETSSEAGPEETPEDGDEVAAEDEDETIYPLPALVLAYPDSPVASAACNAIANNLRRIGIDLTLRQLPPGQGRPADNDWDLLYVETTIEEPIVDLPELILGQSLLGRHGGLVRQATRTMQESSDLSEAREHFMRIHKLTYDHTPLIPLWQLNEHAAANRYVRGIPESPVTLYRGISNWQLRP